MILAISGNEAKVAIDGEKFLKLLGITEDDSDKEDLADIICKKLLLLSEKEREELFNKAKLTERRVIDMTLAERMAEEIEVRHSYSFRIVGPNYIETTKSVAEIKKELKRCNNYMQRKKLEQELQAAYKNAKAGLVV